MELNTRVIVICFIFQNVVAGDNIVKRVKDLENEKKELYKQINAAIVESLRTLRKSNNSESMTGLKYMEELQKHMTEFNKTNNNLDIGADLDSKSYLENRRQHSFNYIRKSKKNKENHDPFDFEAVLRPKDASPAEWKHILENRLKVQMKLDDWILNREREKERLKDYRLQKKRLIMSGKYEKCPRFGYVGTENKNGKNKDGSKKTNSKKNKYPCCRKCCKKSYMGCL